MSVLIVIVNYNTGYVLSDCLESIFKFENNDNMEIVIVDNCSRDNSKDVIEKFSSKHKNIRTILLENKVSYSSANNSGVKISSSDFVLIMNPDIIFTEPVLENLIHQFEVIENLGAICPALLGTDGKFQRNYFQRYPTLRQFVYFYSFVSKIFYRYPKLMNKYLENQDIDVLKNNIQFIEQIPCAFFLTKRSIFNEAGMMDEHFELFFEDVDLSYRINKNYKLAVDTSLRVTHIGGSSLRTAENWRLYGRVIMSMNRFFDKYYNFAAAFLLKVISASNSILTLMIEYVKKIFGKSDKYRLNKHKYFLKLFKERYL